jgi:hypothetical protein
MKGQVQSKMIVATLAALCAWSGQTSAIDGQDAVFACKLYTTTQQDGAGTTLWLKANASSISDEGQLQITTSESAATTFTFSRKSSWKHDTGGTAYYMTGSRYGRCIGFTASTPATLTAGTVVRSNQFCSDTNRMKVVLDKQGLKGFTIRNGAAGTLYFKPQSNTSGSNVLLAKFAADTTATQVYYAKYCRTATNGQMRPKTGF